VNTDRLPHLCPYCGHAQIVNPDYPPAPGDVSVCLACAWVSVFDRTPDGALTTRCVTAAEWAQLEGDPTVARAVALARDGLEQARDQRVK
jgi:hypothetical protein